MNTSPSLEDRDTQMYPELRFIDDDILQLWVSQCGPNPYRQWSVDAVKNMVNLQLIRSLEKLTVAVLALESETKKYTTG